MQERLCVCVRMFVCICGVWLVYSWLMCSMCMYTREQYFMHVCAYMRMRVWCMTSIWCLCFILFESYMRLDPCAACVCMQESSILCLCVRMCVCVCGVWLVSTAWGAFFSSHIWDFAHVQLVYARQQCSMRVCVCTHVCALACAVHDSLVEPEVHYSWVTSETWLISTWDMTHLFACDALIEPTDTWNLKLRSILVESCKRI